MFTKRLVSFWFLKPHGERLKGSTIFLKVWQEETGCTPETKKILTGQAVYNDQNDQVLWVRVFSDKNKKN